jgi:hypothetical protein
MASLSPQLTEQPPQLPRGVEGGALQELTCALRSPLDERSAPVLGGPDSVEGGARVPLSFVAQPANDSTMSRLAASEAFDTRRQGSVLTHSY